MTERPLSITTQLATPIQAAIDYTPAIPPNDALPVIESADEEPYTIKCICDYGDDDGNTIYCEKCDTWQHIECFYPGRVEDASKEDFDHACAECKPRLLDRRHATERQRQRQNKAALDTTDKKTKRPPSKSHKKKSKPSDLLVNGHHDHHDALKNGSPQDHHPPTKKSKGHRASQSVSSKRSPPFTARTPHNHAHPPSPAHTPPDLPPDLQVHSYSQQFLSLYDNDNYRPTTSNTMATLTVASTMSMWTQDPAKLESDAGIPKEEQHEVLQPQKDNNYPTELQVEEKHDATNNTPVHWRQLKTRISIQRGARIGELNGQVGFQVQYCQDPDNRWIEFPHARPFVFFHSRLPLFIDTRQEGSTCRFVRRSCKPNADLELMNVAGSGLHFNLVSRREISVSEQITIPWDFRFPTDIRPRYLHLLNLDEDGEATIDGTDATPDEYDNLTATIFEVLSDHGGCACGLDHNCAFARFHRNFLGRPHPLPNSLNGIVKSKKGRKPKLNHVSPTSTGHATNSRAASEGQGEQVEEDDNRSISGSVKSKPHSRDLTPSQGLGETNGILTGLSDREKRKIEKMEDSFRKMEQQGPQRKKKRASESSSVPLPSQATPKPRQKSIVSRMQSSQPPLPRGRQYVDASTSRRQSGSPYSAASPAAALHSPESHPSRGGSVPRRSRLPTPAPKSVYADSTTQTEEVADAWWNDPKSKPKRSFVPLAKRLLKNRHRVTSQQELQRSQPALTNGSEDHGPLSSPTSTMDIDAPSMEDRVQPVSPADPRGRHASVSSSIASIDHSTTSVDVTMTEAPPILVGMAIKPPPPPWPVQSNAVNGINPALDPRSPDLRVQRPPTPTVSTQHISGSLSGSITPSSANGSLAQSPSGTVHVPAGTPSTNGNHLPAPTKLTKKLSLSDYKAARLKKSESDLSANKASGNSPTSSVALKPALPTVEEDKAPVVLDGPAIIDSPMLEKIVDPVASVTETTAETASK